jgi:hypothetical protein
MQKHEIQLVENLPKTDSIQWAMLTLTKEDFSTSDFLDGFLVQA